jgi:hypothetical protein
VDPNTQDCKCVESWSEMITSKSDTCSEVSSLSEMQSVSSTFECFEGHRGLDHPHYCNGRSSPLSPLLRTNQESRYEVQKFGKLTSYYGRESILDYSIGPELKQEVAIPIYFHFGVDTLAMNELNIAELHTKPSQGLISELENVTSMIVVNPKSDDVIAELLCQVAILKRFSLQQLYVLDTQTEALGGELKIVPLEQIYGDNDADNYRKLFEITRELFDWIAGKLGRKPVEKTEIVCGQRKRHAGERWGIDKETDKLDNQQDNPGNYHNRNSWGWLQLVDDEWNISLLLKEEGVKGFEKELAKLCGDWSARAGAIIT